VGAPTIPSKEWPRSHRGARVSGFDHDAALWPLAVASVLQPLDSGQAVDHDDALWLVVATVIHPRAQVSLDLSPSLCSAAAATEPWCAPSGLLGRRRSVPMGLGATVLQLLVVAQVAVFLEAFSLVG